MLVEERRRRLLETLHRQGALSVAEAERRLKVSRMTIHRDLDVLAERGLLRKVHGGAVPNNGQALEGARPFEERSAASAAAKRAIAQHLLDLTKDAATLVLDASSTVHAFAQALPADGRDRFVVTGGLHVFRELAQKGGRLRVALHGGEPHPHTGSLVGPLAHSSLSEMRFDWAVLSAASWDAKECVAYDATPEEAELKRAYLAHARRKVLAVDSSKLERSAPYRLAAQADFDAVVTEHGVLSAPKPKSNRTGRSAR